jgi:hypothetical protein
MQGTELFLSLAEIAGVFVGFGALIAVRSGSSAETEAIQGIRWVLSSGVWVVVAALAPIILGQYGIGSHELWLWCSLAALGLLAVLILAYGLAPEYRADIASSAAAVGRAKLVLVTVPTFLVPEAVLVLALVVVILGLAPHHEQALYLTAVGLGLFQAAFQLLIMVFWPSSASSEPDRSVKGSVGGA